MLYRGASCSSLELHALALWGDPWPAHMELNQNASASASSCGVTGRHSIAAMRSDCLKHSQPLEQTKGQSLLLHLAREGARGWAP